ncbi:MAG: hypothetical protein ABSG86_13630 [Thermoguttaceae bacterium]
MSHPTIWATLLVAIWLAAVSPGMGGQPEPAAPSTVLFDTKSPLPDGECEAALGSKSGWAAVPEDNVTHRFQADAVAMNDRLIVVLRGQGRWAEVYARTAAGPKRHVLLSPITAAGQQPAALASVRILENNPGAVMLAATFTAAGGGMCSATYRLAAGQMIVEVRPGEGTGRLLVRRSAAFVVVPDFFGNDMVFHVRTSAKHGRLRLPAENFFVTLSDKGNAQVMCVWPSRKQQATALFGSHFEGPRKITGCEIEAVKDKSIWVAVLEGSKLWHEQTISAEDAKRDLVLDWKPPFSAKWRADLLAGDGGARSWYFRNLDGAGQLPPEAGDSPPVCCLEAGRAVLRLDRGPRTVPSAWHYPAPLLAYAMDRDRATPLTTFCPMDVLRNTLGVGPCQYILQTEGLATEATPDNVMTWVEKQFSRKKEKKEAEEIRRQLDEMVKHIGHAQARIGQYGRLAEEVRELCKADAGLGDRAAATLNHIAVGLQQTAAAAEKLLPADRAAPLVARVIGLVGKADGAAQCQRLGAAVRAIGAGQDATLSNCRMAVRWLRQSAAMIAEEDPRGAELARAVQARADQFLAGSEKQGR